MILALDIETLGLLEKKPLPEITCVCLYDGTTEYLLQFYKVEPDVRTKNTSTLLSLLDSAKRLVGFNAVLFDLEFIKRTFSISEERMTAWVVKTIDPYMFMKFALNSTSGMEALLKINGLPSKIGSGAQAITLALEGKFDNLLAYCLMDAKLVYKLCKLDEIKLGNCDEILKINLSSGKWILVEKIPHKKTMQNKNKKKVVPNVDGILLQNVNMQQALFQEPPVDPEKRGWCE